MLARTTKRSLHSVPRVLLNLDQSAAASSRAVTIDDVDAAWVDMTRSDTADRCEGRALWFAYCLRDVG